MIMILYDSKLVILQGVQFGAPEPSPARTPIEELAGNAQRILDIFAANGYAIKVQLVVWCRRDHSSVLCCFADLPPQISFFAQEGSPYSVQSLHCSNYVSSLNAHSKRCKD